MRLDESEIIGAYVAARIDTSEECGLIGSRGKRYAVRSAVRIDVAAGDQRVNAIVRRAGGVEPAQDENAAALGPHIAVGFGRECLAAAGARQH